MARDKGQTARIEGSECAATAKDELHEGQPGTLEDFLEEEREEFWRMGRIWHILYCCIWKQHSSTKPNKIKYKGTEAQPVRV